MGLDQVKNVLFVTYGGGHAHMVHPVVSEMKKSPQYREGLVNIHVLALTSAKRIMLAHGVESFGFDRYLDIKKDRDAIKWGTELLKNHHSEKSGISREESVAYLGLSFKDLVEKNGIELATDKFNKKGRHSFFPTSIIKRIFDDINPDFVVTTNSPRAEAASIQVANDLGINNLLMNDLFSLMEGYKIKAKNVTFLNTIAKEMMESAEQFDENISCAYFTGNPAFDCIINETAGRDPLWLESEFPGTKGRKVILHADMPAYWDPVGKCSYFKTDEDNLKEINAIYRSAQDNDAVMLVRPHPSQENEFYDSWLRGKEDAYLAASCNLHKLLQNVSLLVVRTSTVGLEAYYLGTKILQLDSSFHSDLPLVSMGVAAGAESLDELSEKVKLALNSKVTDSSVASTLLPRKKASNQITKIIFNEMRMKS